MSPEELRAHVTSLREVSSSPLTLKAQLTAKKAEAKSARTTEPKASGASLLNKYANLGKKEN